jgi:Type II CAAX prenyl endopeptidase Rce1-like
MNKEDRFPWRLFWLLFTGGLIGVAAVMPYVFALFGGTLQRLPFPLPLLLALQFVQSAIVLAIAVGIGLLVSRKIGLGAPALEAWLYRRTPVVKPGTFLISVIAGAAVGIIIVFLVYFVFLPLIPQLPVAAEGVVPLWKRFLACFYGGLDEEILMRLFLLSLLLWLVQKIRRNHEQRPSGISFWMMNSVISVVFGLAHLPAARLIMPITSMSIFYILSLNGIAALVFGYLYWRRGLEAAMVAHFSADIVLHVIGPVFLKGASA